MIYHVQDVDAQYYGFRDDDDGLLVPLELAAEKNAIGQYLTNTDGIWQYLAGTDSIWQTRTVSGSSSQYPANRRYLANIQTKEISCSPAHQIGW